VTDYDVVILGSGLGGSITASALAKKGWRVLLLDSACHPRFAIGEATTPDISFLMKIVATRFDIPELNNLTTFHRLRDNVSSSCGIKKSFSFLYQRDGEDQNPEESHQFPTLAPPFGPDCHLFRQDTDAYMVGAAVKHGADLKQNVKINEFDFDDDGVTLRSEAGETFTARYLVDATGFRSPIADKFDLREKPTRLKTKSRALFTHLVGAELYDDVSPDLKEFGLSYPLAEGTLHHVFDGGWMWVIPFNNRCAALASCWTAIVSPRRIWNRSKSGTSSSIASPKWLSSSGMPSPFVHGLAPIAFSIPAPISSEIATACYLMRGVLLTRCFQPD